MNNLAGNTTEVCDENIFKELNQANIEVDPVDNRFNKEVPTHFVGKKSGWTFTRAWYYWVAMSDKGIVLDIANKMNEEWAETIRVVGCSGGTDPKGWLNDHGCIDSYHIDTQEGLNHFAGVLERLGNN